VNKNCLLSLFTLHPNLHLNCREDKPHLAREAIKIAAKLKIIALAEDQEHNTYAGLRKHGREVVLKGCTKPSNSAQAPPPQPKKKKVYLIFSSSTTYEF
jgi:hypothetical protein